MPQPEATRANVAALIPAYFEERRIRDVAARAKDQLDVVLVVDDGSTDQTSEQAKAANVDVIRHEKNAGKGAAIKTGLRELLAVGMRNLVIPSECQPGKPDDDDAGPDQQPILAPSQAAEFRHDLVVENQSNQPLGISWAGIVTNSPESSGSGAASGGASAAP